MDGQTGGQTDRQQVSLTYSHIDRQMNGKLDRQTGRQTDMQAVGQRLSDMHNMIPTLYNIAYV